MSRYRKSFLIIRFLARRLPAKSREAHLLYEIFLLRFYFIKSWQFVIFSLYWENVSKNLSCHHRNISLSIININFQENKIFLSQPAHTHIYTAYNTRKKIKIKFYVIYMYFERRGPFFRCKNNNMQILISNKNTK